MSIELMTKVWGCKTIASPIKKFVLLALADQANAQGYCWPSLKYIAEKTAISRRRVIATINELEDGGFVLKRRRFKSDGTFDSTMYFIDAKKLEEILESNNDLESPDSDAESLGSDGRSLKPSLVKQESCMLSVSEEDLINLTARAESCENENLRKEDCDNSKPDGLEVDFFNQPKKTKTPEEDAEELGFSPLTHPVRVSLSAEEYKLRAGKAIEKFERKIASRSFADGVGGVDGINVSENWRADVESFLSSMPENLRGVARPFLEHVKRPPKKTEIKYWFKAWREQVEIGLTEEQVRKGIKNHVAARLEIKSPRSINCHADKQRRLDIEERERQEISKTKLPEEMPIPRYIYNQHPEWHDDPRYVCVENTPFFAYLEERDLARKSEEAELEMAGVV